MSFNFTKYNALKKKREERESIEKAGGGHAIAKAMLSSEACTKDANTCKAKYCIWPRCCDDSDVDFDFGANVKDIDERIAEQQAERCMERVECPACGHSHGFCAEIKEDKEKYKMLPTGNEDSGRTRGKSTVKWLKVEDLSTTPKEAKVLAVNYNKEGRFGPRVELKLAFDGEITYWGVDPKKNSANPNYRDLTAKFGHDENNWVDQRILLYVEPHKFYEGQFNIRVDFPKPKRG